MQPGKKRLRVLCLHSWRTSGSIFKEQFERAKLGPALDDLVEMVFVDAPNKATGRAPRDVLAGFPGRDYYEWFTVEGAEENIEEFQLAHFGLDASEAYVERVIREQGPFDGLMGFSQGAVVAATMAAMQRVGMTLRGAPPLRFVCVFGAAHSRHPRHLEAFQQGRVEIPTCHIIGHKDFIKEHSVNLVRQFDSPIVICHPRGHVIPNLQGPQLAVLRAFLESMAQPPLAAQLPHQLQQQPPPPPRSKL